MFSNLTKSSFVGKQKIKNGISFNSIVNGDRIIFSIYNSREIILYESFNNLDDLKSIIEKESLTEREQFLKNLVCFLCDIEEKQIQNINESLEDDNNVDSIEFEQDEEEDNDIEQQSAEDEDDGVLDDIHTGLGNMNKALGTLLKPNVPKIYAFTTSSVPDAVKIGFTVKPAEQRLDQWRQKYPDAELIYWWPATLLVNNIKSYFKDFPVHEETIEKGFDNLAQIDFAKDVYFSKEFFRRMSRGENSQELTKEIISEIIEIVKDEIINKTHGKNYTSYNLEDDSKTELKEPQETNFKNTPLQDEAIQEGIRIYKSGENKMLLAAVMRFGKTHVAYSITKGVGAKFVLVSSAKVTTKAEWRNGIYHAAFRNAVFVEFKDNYHILVSDRVMHWYMHEMELGNFNLDFYTSEGRMVIIFASLQDLSGKKVKESEETDFIQILLESRVQKIKHKDIFGRQNDLFIIDETHYGARGATYGKVSRENADEIDDTTTEDENEIKKLEKAVTKIPTVCQLHLSGTPYQIMTTGEFSDSQIVGRYSYTDMLEARDRWIADNVTGDEEDENYTGPKESDSPFFGIPDVIRFGMKLTKECRRIQKRYEEAMNAESKLSYLFACEPGKLEFHFEDAIKELAEAIFGGDKVCGFLNEDNIVRGEIFKHIVCVLPSVKACHVFRKLLIENKLLDKDRNVIVAVENESTPKMDKCAETVDLLNAELKRLEDSGKKSLTLTYSRLMTGASVPLWDSMLYMKDTDSAQEYDQAIFRICTRNVGVFKSGNKIEKVNLKPHVYLVDFKVDRMFKIIADSAQAVTDTKKQRGLGSLKANVSRDLTKIPLYVEWKSKGMNRVEPEDFMQYYTRYSRDNSVDDIIKIGLNKFNISGFGTDITNILDNFTKGSLHVNNVVNATKGDGESEVPFNIGVVDDNGDFVSREKLSKNKKEENDTKEKLISLLKNILYLVICLDGTIESLEDLIEILKNDSDTEETGKVFLGENAIGILEKLESGLDVVGLNEIDSEIRNINKLLNDPSLNEQQRMSTAIKKLGKLDKNEVVTPESLAKKMIDKLDDTDYQNADIILEVNSKTGEFITEIYKKYNKEIAEKVKVIPSSNITRQFIKKIFNILDLSIENILPINTKDFLTASMPKFDVILMNPPYGNGLDFKILDKCIQLGDAISTIQPCIFLFGKNKESKSLSYINNIKSAITEYGAEIENVEGVTVFSAAPPQDLAIITLDKNKKSNIRLIGYSDNVAEFDSADDIKKYGNNLVLLELENKLKALYEKDNFWNHVTCGPRAEGHLGKKENNKKIDYNPNLEEIIVPLTSVRGHRAGNDDFYTTIPRNLVPVKYKDYKGNKGNDTPWYYIKCKDISYANNLIDYLKSDFVRACLFFNKTSTSLELNYIPWLDFSKKSTDKELFKKFNITEEEQKLIKEVLPDYYSIR